MKKFLRILCLTICLALLIAPVNENIISLVAETAPSPAPSGQESISVPNDTADIVIFSSDQPDSSSPDEPNLDRTLPEQTRNNLPASIELNFNSNDNPDVSAENNVLNPLPEKTTPEKPDTLAKIINWWAENPFGMKLWYLFLLISMIMFIFGLTSFRKPLLFASIVIFGFYLGNTVNPINSIFSLPVANGTKLINSFILVIIPILLSLFIGRFFCGWVCPVGAVQELIHPVNFKFRLPYLLERIFSYFRFLLLIIGLLFSWSEISNIWNLYDPFQSLFNCKWPLIATFLLGIVLTGSIFIERFFCRYLCPLGGILALTSKFSLVKMKADSNTCIACGKCSQPKACPMDMISANNPYTDLPTIEASECILCHQCADICRYSAIKFSGRQNSNAIKEEATGVELSS